MSEFSDTVNLEKRLISYLGAPGYEPQDPSAIARGMGISSQERPALRELLKDWQAQGKIVRLRQARFILRSTGDEPLMGRIRKLPKGKIIFIPNDAGQESLRGIIPDSEYNIIEVEVPIHRDNGAMDGDLVKATVKRNIPRQFHRRHRGAKHRPDATELRLEATITEILERKRGSWVGIYRPGGRYGYLEGDGRIVPQRVRITEAPPPELLFGMSIVAEIVSYPRGKMDATARVTSVLGWPQDNGVDVTAIMHRHALRDTFPQEVLSESEALSEEISAEEYATREDWRQEPVFTIDPESARDYDDAICVKEYTDYTELAVHIADVSHYVKPGSALDAEAYLRGNSTYLPDRVLPMLPPKLCDNICSLKEGVDRLTKLCVMRINRKGEVFRAEFKSAVICSIRRLSYGQALAVIEGRDSTGSEQLDTALHVAHKLAEKMRRLRLKNGALDLQIPELRIEVDAQGKVADIQQEYSDAAHQMIEEFMLAANEAVAAALTRALTPTIYRIHEEPDASKLQSFAYMVRDYGIKAGSLSSRKELMAVVEQIKGHSDEQILTTALLRSMMRARYSTRAMGHFGLAKNDYCHFTSPIRRYADLIVHRGFNRLVFGKNARVHLPDMGRLAEIAEHISETERSSAAAEHEAKQVKITAFLAEECESEHPRVWQAVITDSYPQGLAVEVQMLQVKGFISGEKIEEALGARWYFERHTRRWSSTEGEYLYPGCRIDVVPCYVDELSGFVDFKPSSSE